MNYLFYDLEFACCNPGHKICEFGYVLTDENFNLLEENNFDINPGISRKAWDQRVRRQILKKPIEEYEKCPKFDFFYQDIVKIFSKADYVFGHSNDGDAQGLNDECKRYGLSSIDHTFYDIKYMYKVYINLNREVGLDNILKELNVIGDPDSHIAKNDAYNTMVALRTMIQNKNVSLDEFLEMCPRSKNKSENFIVESIARNKLLREERAKKESNYILKDTKKFETFKSFIENVQVTKEGNNKLKDKVISIYYSYEKTHFKEMINLIQMIKNEGGSYTRSAKTCDIFVRDNNSNETEDKCKRLECVEIFNSNNEKQIEIIQFEELLNLLSITNEELEAMPLPDYVHVEEEDLRFRHRQRSKKKETKTNVAPVVHLTNSLESIFKEYMNR